MKRLDLSISIDSKEIITVVAPVEDETFQDYLKELDGKTPTHRQIFSFLHNTLIKNGKKSSSKKTQ